jgi:hypothetical protein
VTAVGARNDSARRSVELMEGKAKGKIKAGLKGDTC